MNDENIPIRESNNCIYHFSHNYEGFVNIFRQKIKPQYCVEDFSSFYGVSSIYNYENGDTLNIPLKIAQPIFCLCDIPYGRLSVHKKRHGNFGIGFKKEWGKKNNLNIVSYSHPQSITSASFRILINYFTKNQKDIIDFEKNYRCFSYIIMTYKPYEYYEEREWRWIPLYDDILLAIKYNGNEADFKKEIDKNQEIINSRDDIKLDFSIDDIEYIIIDNDKKDKFIEDIKNFYDANDIQKISKLIDKNNSSAAPTATAS